MVYILYFAVILVSLVILSLSKQKAKLLLSLYVFFLPFFGLQYDLGVQVNIDRVFSFLMLIYLFYLVALNKLKLHTSLFHFLLFVFYMISITLIMGQFLPDIAKNYPALRGEYRYLVQIFMWSLILTPVIFTTKAVQKLSDIFTLYKVLFYSASILSLLGIFQWIIYYSSGIDIFPIGFLQEDTIGTSKFKFQGLEIFRITSLGGEPKHFAYTLAHILPLSLVLYILGYKFYFLRLSLFFQFAALFLTFSTQGYILLSLNLMVCLFLMIIFRKINKKTMLVLLLLVSFFVISSILFDIFAELVKVRTLERYYETYFIEDSNRAVLDFLINKPIYIFTGVGLGNIHLYAQDYIPDYALHYMVGNVFVAKSGFLRIISEIGILGLVLLLVSFYNLLRKIISVSKYNNSYFVILVFSICSLFSFSLSADGPIYIFLAIAFMHASVRLERHIGRANKDVQGVIV